MVPGVDDHPELPKALNVVEARPSVEHQIQQEHIRSTNCSFWFIRVLKIDFHLKTVSLNAFQTSQNFCIQVTTSFSLMTKTTQSIEEECQCEQFRKLTQERNFCYPTVFPLKMLSYPIFKKALTNPTVLSLLSTETQISKSG